jgi:hypothetical protein
MACLGPRWAATEPAGFISIKLQNHILLKKKLLNHAEHKIVYTSRQPVHGLVCIFVSCIFAIPIYNRVAFIQ